MKIRPKTVDYVAGKRYLGRYSTCQSLSSIQREKRVHSQPDTTLFQGRLASSHAKRAKSDRVSVWAREKERESGGEIVTERNKERERERPRRQIKRAREK